MAKKVIVGLIILGMLLSTFAAAFAEPKTGSISKEEAKKIAMDRLKDNFSVDVSSKEFSETIQFRPDYENTSTYVWEVRYTNDNTPGNYYSVEVEQGGQIRAVDMYSNNAGQPSASRISQSKAEKIAKEYIQKLNGDIFEQLQLANDGIIEQRGQQPSVRVRYIRKIGEALFENNYIAVEVSAADGKIISYSARWESGLTVKDMSKVIGLKRAQEEIRKNMKMELSYIPKYERDNPEETVKNVALVYTQDMNSYQGIDAMTGEVVDFIGRELGKKKSKEASQKDIEALRQKVKARELRAQKEEMNQEDAKSYLNSYASELLGKGYTLDSQRYVDGKNYWESSGKKAWTAEYTNTAEAKHGSITVDATSGELIRFFGNYDANEDSTKDIGWENAYDKSLEFIQTHFSSKLGELELLQTEYTILENPNYKKDPYYYFNFTRKVNNIPFESNNINIRISKETGKIEDAAYNWNYDISFPDTKKIIEESAAKEKYISSHDMALYLVPEIGTKGERKNLKAIYKLTSKNVALPVMNIDALTGKTLDYNGLPIVEYGGEFYEKVKNRKDSEILLALLNQRVLTEEEFSPEKSITRIEALRMMARAKGFEPFMIQNSRPLSFGNVKAESKDYGVLQFTRDMGLIEDSKNDFDFNSPISREEMASMLTKFIGYGELAQKDIFKTNFKDQTSIKSVNYGAVAITTGLGIIKETGENFNPQRDVTMEEMAVSIYYALGMLPKMYYGG